MIKKPDILSYDNMLKVCVGKDISICNAVIVAQAQNDHCYKEMLGQFRDIMRLADELAAYILLAQDEIDKRCITIPKVWSKPIDTKYIEGLIEKAEDWQTLQSQLEE